MISDLACLCHDSPTVFGSFEDHLRRPRTFATNGTCTSGSTKKATPSTKLDWVVMGNYRFYLKKTRLNHEDIGISETRWYLWHFLLFLGIGVFEHVWTGHGDKDSMAFWRWPCRMLKRSPTPSGKLGSHMHCTLRHNKFWPQMLTSVYIFVSHVQVLPFS